jgi:hypothetical protein
MFYMHPREILFGSQRALLTNVAEYGDLAEALSTLGLNPPQPVLVIVGGASGMTADELVKTKELFDNVLVPYADLHQIAIMDGGTDAGVMQAIGDARSNHNATFPLIGIVIEKGIGATILENGQFPSSILEPNHTHFILTPGENWDGYCIMDQCRSRCLFRQRPGTDPLIQRRRNRLGGCRRKR